MGARVVPAPVVRELDIGGCATLFVASSQTAVMLNATASEVWRLIDGTRDVDDIVAALTAVYDADAEVIRSGVDEVLARLRDQGLVVGDR